jgi:hypothetical protein
MGASGTGDGGGVAGGTDHGGLADGSAAAQANWCRSKGRDSATGSRRRTDGGAELGVWSGDRRRGSA